MQATSRLQEQLRQMQQTNAKATSELRSKMMKLEAEKFSETLLKQNLTRTVESADSAASKARKEKMGLLVQVSELQEQSSAAQKKVLAAEKEAKLAKEDAQKSINKEVLAAKHEESERQRRISSLLQES